MNKRDSSWDARGLFSQYGNVEEVSGVMSDIVLQVTLTHKRFANIPNVLMCRERRMLVIVEGQ